MGTMDKLPECVRCHRAVRRNKDLYDVFERMHWACFHYEFEHDVAGDTLGDPDEACTDPACPARAFDPHPPPDFLSGGRPDADPELPPP